MISEFATGRTKLERCEGFGTRMISGRGVMERELNERDFRPRAGFAVGEAFATRGHPVPIPVLIGFAMTDSSGGI
jgi:hypothetical protein